MPVRRASGRGGIAYRLPFWLVRWGDVASKVVPYQVTAESSKSAVMFICE